MSGPLTSPTLSAVSAASSFVVLSDNVSMSLSAGATTASDLSDDDEIVYSVSERSFLSSSSRVSAVSSDSDPASDEDFVVLSGRGSPRPTILNRNRNTTGLSTPISMISTDEEEDGNRASTPNIGSLTAGLAKLAVGNSNLTQAKKSRKKKPKKSKALYAVVTDTASAASSYPSPVPSPTGKGVVKKGKGKGRKKKAIGLGERSVVDDASDRFSEYTGESDIGSPSVYDEAVKYITTFLSNPAAKEDSACRLTLLQALIIELGLAPSSLPASLKAAKTFLKTRAFLNIKEYLAVRSQGPAAVQRIMFPSRSALVKDIRKNKDKKAPRAWVKDKGLQVLLVQCYN